MPTYSFECQSCTHIEDRFLRMSDYDVLQVCNECNRPMRRVILAPPMVTGDYPGYECPVTGKWVEGRRAHEENLKRTGCRVLEPGEREQNTLRRRQEEAAFDKAVDETLDAEIAKMPARKLEKLESELRAGADIQTTRSSPNVSA